MHSCRVNPEIKYARRFKALKIPDIVHTKVTEKLCFGLMQLHKLINCCSTDYTIHILIISVGLKACEFFKVAITTITTKHPSKVVFN